LACAAPCTADITNSEDKALQTSVSAGKPSPQLGPTTANAEKAVMQDASRVKKDIDASLKALNKIKGGTDKLAVGDQNEVGKMKSAVHEAAVLKKRAMASAPDAGAVISSWNSKPPPAMPSSSPVQGAVPTVLAHEPGWFKAGPYAIMGKAPAPSLSFSSCRVWRCRRVLTRVRA